MCGVIGVVSRHPLTHDIDAALSALRHRGPDGSGSDQLRVGGGYAWLGHTRLSILDRSPAGHQPMRSHDGRWWLSFNGEIYNHLELRKELCVAWRGHSDTETLVECLAAWGVERTLPRLNGMFAFGALDELDEQLYLVRDPFGVKPLYYWDARRDTLAFSSELRALFALSGEASTLDHQSLQTFLTLRFVPSPHTLHQGIKRVPPGHVLVHRPRSGRYTLTCYTRYPSERFRGTLEDAVEGYYELLSRAVQRQLLSDVPLGIFLSGGVDSALIAALATKHGGKLPSYTVGYGADVAECELDDAAETAAMLGLEHHAITVTESDLWDAAESCVSAIEEPLGTPSVLPMWHLAKRARRDVTVVLTGQGADEPWGGYRRYQAEIWRNYLPFPTLIRPVGALLRHLPNVPEYLERGAVSIPISDRAERFQRAYALFSPLMRRELTKSDDSGFAGDSIRYWLDWVETAGLSSVESMMAIDTRMGLADDLLLYGDKITMAHSLEARVPMLDVELVSYVESLPIEYRLSLHHTKIVHKLAATKHLAPAIVRRRKRAFSIPFDRLAKTVWKDRIADILFDPLAPHWDTLQRSGVTRLWREYMGGRRSRGRQMFALMAFCLWYRQIRTSNARVRGALTGAV